MIDFITHLNILGRFVLFYFGSVLFYANFLAILNTFSSKYQTFKKPAARTERDKLILNGQATFKTYITQYIYTIFLTYFGAVSSVYFIMLNLITTLVVYYSFLIVFVYN